VIEQSRHTVQQTADEKSNSRNAQDNKGGGKHFSFTRKVAAKKQIKEAG
jgi:hypothetical protein